jgi:hypothetical protein
MGGQSALPSAMKGGETDMMKDYIVGGRQYQFEEGTQPENAVEVKKVEPQDKAVKPQNKKRKVQTK